jgi:hypothetical protein
LQQAYWTLDRIKCTVTVTPVLRSQRKQQEQRSGF